MLVDVSRVTQVCQRLIESAVDVFGPECRELFGGVASPPVVQEGEETVLSSHDDDSTTSDNIGKSPDYVSILLLLSLAITAVSKEVAPLSSHKQHLSYDDCLEIRGEIIRTVLCCIVY